jgi:hypothetical protein
MNTHETLNLKSSQPQGSSDRMFGFVLGTALCVFGLIPFLKSHAIRTTPIALSLLFFLPAIFKPVLLRQLNKLWTQFGLLLQRITNPIIMGVLFFGVITPLSFMMKRMKKDLLNLKFDPQAKSYWVKKEKDPNGSMKNQF